MKPSRTLAMILTSVLNIALLLGCASKAEEEEQAPEQQIFERAMRAMDSNNYQIAIQLLEELERRYPFGEYTTQSQAEIIYAYFSSLDYGAAKAAAERFISLYPNHPNTDYAYYMKAITTYPALYQVFQKTKTNLAYRRDIEAGRASFFELREFVQRFPQSPYTADALKRMVYLRNLLGKHEVYVAAFYFKRRAYIAALRRVQGVLKEYPQTKAVADALSLQVAAHLRLNQRESADKTLAILRENYSDHPSLDENGKYIVPTAKKITWFHRISQGFFYDNEGEVPLLNLNQDVPDRPRQFAPITFY